MQIAIVGTGKLARAIAYGLRETAHDLVFGSRRAEEAEALARLMSEEHARRYRGATVEGALVRADLSILAVPFAAALEIVAANRGALDGRIVVDPTNALGPDGEVAILGEDSASERLAAAAGPRARVVCAFKNSFAASFAEPGIGGGPAPDVLVAGDDEAARATVLELVRATGFSALDAGPLRSARAIERLTPLLIRLDAAHGWQGHSGVKILHG